jgi:hypothetical protein
MTLSKYQLQWIWKSFEVFNRKQFAASSAGIWELNILFPIEYHKPTTCTLYYALTCSNYTPTYFEPSFGSSSGTDTILQITHICSSMVTRSRYSCLYPVLVYPSTAPHRIRKATSYVSTDVNAPRYKEVLSTFYQLNCCITNKCNQILWSYCCMCVWFLKLWLSLKMNGMTVRNM